MTGIERNSEVVQMAAYAPLLANVNHQGSMCPTNLIIYDNQRCVFSCPIITCSRPVQQAWLCKQCICIFNEGEAGSLSLLKWRAQLMHMLISKTNI